MSADNERRARELLAAEYEKSVPQHSEHIRTGGNLTTSDAKSIRAIMAALDEPAGPVGGESALGREVRHWLDNLPNAMRVREGAGDECLAKSFAVNVSALTSPAPPVVDEAALRALVTKWRDSDPLVADHEEWAAYDARDICADELEAALTQPSQPSAPVVDEAMVLAPVSVIERAIARALVFDDGSDGADAESAQSVVAILRGLLTQQPAMANEAARTCTCRANAGHRENCALFDEPEGSGHE